MRISNGNFENDFAFYKIAFQWYALLGVIAMWLPAILISFLTGGQDFTNFNVQLLSPCVQKLLPKKYRHTELKVIQTASPETNAWNSKSDEKFPIKS